MNRFWALNNSGATPHVDLEPPREIILLGIFGAYVMEKPRTVHNLFTFIMAQSGGISRTQPHFLLDNIKLILKWCVMAGQADGHANSLLNVMVESTLSVCRKFGC